MRRLIGGRSGMEREGAGWSQKSEKSEKSEVLEGEAFSVKGQKVASGFDCNYLLRSILQKTCKLWMG